MAVKRMSIAAPRNGGCPSRRGIRGATARKNQHRYPKPVNRFYILEKVPYYVDVVNGVRLAWKRIPVSVSMLGRKYQEGSKMPSYMDRKSPAPVKPLRKFKMPDASEEKPVPFKVNIKFNIDAEPLIKKNK